MQTFLVDENTRLDIFLSKILNQSRNQVTLLVKNDCVKINDKIQNKNSFKLKMGDKISLTYPPLQEIKEQYAVDFEVEILYEDDDVLVLNKPCGLVVHGASSVKSATLVDWLISKKFTLSNLGGEMRAGLVHRLDKETSGAILIAKNNAAHQHLSEQLQNKTMGRIYLALIDLPLKEGKIIVDKALVRSPHNRIKKIAIDERDEICGAKMAKSAFLNLLECGNFTLIAAKLFTGRTHQIRAHLASLNRHILGDSLYGYQGLVQKVMLHAYFLYFIHPKSGQEIFIKAPLREDFREKLIKKITQGELDEKISQEYLLSEFSTFI